jgi:hypothetical protein
MTKEGYIIHRLGYLDFFKNPKLSAIPHLIEHLFARNIIKALPKNFSKIKAASDFLSSTVKIKDINLKNFKSLINNNIYLLDKKIFEIEKRRLIEEFILQQYNAYHYFDEKVLEKLVCFQSSKTYLKKYYHFLVNLKFSYLKEIFNKFYNKDKSFLFFFENKKLKYFKFPSRDKLPSLPSFNPKIKKELHFKKDKNMPSAISFGLFLDLNIKNLFFLGFFGSLINSASDPESFSVRISFEEGLTYWRSNPAVYLPNKILAFSVFPSLNIKKIEKLFFKFLNSMSLKNKNLQKNFYLRKKRFLLEISDNPDFNSKILFLFYLHNNEKIILNKTYIQEIKKLKLENFIEFLKRIQKTNELFTIKIF